MIAAAVAQLFTVAAQLGLPVQGVTPEMISLIGGALTVAMVYLIPNRL